MESKRPLRFLHIDVFILVLIIAATSNVAKAQGGATAQSAPKQESADPTLEHRLPPEPKSPVIPEGKIQLDVVVTDQAGKPVVGLQPWDFKILDNDQPRKVMSFRAFDGTAVKPDPPVEVILVIDTVNLPFAQVSFARQQLEQFLQQNGGHLQQPVTIGLFTDTGVRMQSLPSTDGNALVSIVSGIKGSVRTLDSAMGADGMVQRFQLSVTNIATIAENETLKPGRKLLIWVGPGWPMLNRPDISYSERSQKLWFDSIVELSTRLREARIAVYSVSPVSATNENTFVYQSFLKGVSTFRQADSGNLSLKVLATQTGGEVFGPGNDLVGQINRCVDDANAFYRISFDPPAAAHADEYHALKVTVDKPGTTVRTNTGYYNQPPGQ